MEGKTIDKERIFSVELKSKRDLRNVTLANGQGESVLIEGTIGRLVQATFTEGIILEVIGESGSLRLDLEEGEIRKTIDQLNSGGQLDE